jgi:hypothetical protein
LPGAIDDAHPTPAELFNDLIPRQAGGLVRFTPIASRPSSRSNVIRASFALPDDTRQRIKVFRKALLVFAERDLCLTPRTKPILGGQQFEDRLAVRGKARELLAVRFDADLLARFELVLQIELYEFAEEPEIVRRRAAESRHRRAFATPPGGLKLFEACLTLSPGGVTQE